MSPAKIFVVEDNASDVYILRLALAEQCQDLELEIAADGEEALRFIEREKLNPRAQTCVILLDLHLPKYSGMEVLRAIRREPSLRNYPVVVISSYASAEERAELRDLGATCRLKPRGLSEFAVLAADLLSICHEPPPQACATGQG
jgi:CheY-like chemotaxis protein